jgi:hypothetical protein
MQLLNSPWNSLEIIKLFVGVLTPLIVAILGWFISRRLTGWGSFQPLHIYMESGMDVKVLV